MLMCVCVFFVSCGAPREVTASHRGVKLDAERCRLSCLCGLSCLSCLSGLVDRKVETLPIMDSSLRRRPFFAIHCPVISAAEGFRNTRAAYVQVWLELERKNMDQAQVGCCCCCF